MSSKTKILVMKKREAIYTAIFAVLAVIFLILLVMMFRPAADRKNTAVRSSEKSPYTPGVYTTQLTLNNNVMNLEVRVDKSHINSIELVNLSESATASLPLMEPALDNLEAQICATQSTKDVYYEASTQYTSQMLLAAIETALEKARQ